MNDDAIMYEFNTKSMQQMLISCSVPIKTFLFSTLMYDYSHMCNWLIIIFSNQSTMVTQLNAFL